METELKIWLDYSSKEYERETTREDEVDFLSALKRVLGDNRAVQTKAEAASSARSEIFVESAQKKIPSPVRSDILKSFSKFLVHFPNMPPLTGLFPRVGGVL
jgi:hypothetical protein